MDESDGLGVARQQDFRAVAELHLSKGGRQVGRETKNATLLSTKATRVPPPHARANFAPVEHTREGGSVRSKKAILQPKE